MSTVLHVITGLGAGGAEEMLHRLLWAERTAPRAIQVVSLTDIGPVGRRIQTLGVPVVCLGMRPGHPRLSALWRLVRLLRRVRPDLVQTWMYHADLLGGIAARLAGLPVVWGIHHQWSTGDRWLTRLTRRVCAWLSAWVPERVIFASESSRRSHAARGYAPEKLVQIPNGFDVARFRPDPEARAKVRRELGIAGEAPVVGLVARYHPDKDHATFIAAGALVSRRLDTVQFVLCGEGTDASNSDLAAQIEGAGLRSATHLLGARADVERVFSALDVACLSSRTESFPNVVGEAMACGVPCVATDCGDVGAILGETGSTVPVGDHAALADALLAHLALPPEARRAASAAARRRIVEHFALAEIAVRFREVQDQVVAARGAVRSAHRT